MSDIRVPVKLDFTTGLDSLPPRPKRDESTTRASLVAGRQLGFTGREPASKLDGRRLRSRGANIQLNLKVTAQEKEMILALAAELIHDPNSPVSNVGEFVVMAVESYRTKHTK